MSIKNIGYMIININIYLTAIVLLRLECVIYIYVTMLESTFISEDFVMFCAFSIE